MSTSSISKHLNRTADVNGGTKQRTLTVLGVDRRSWFFGPTLPHMRSYWTESPNVSLSSTFPFFFFLFFFLLQTKEQKNTTTQHNHVEYSTIFLCHYSNFFIFVSKTSLIFGVYFCCGCCWLLLFYLTNEEMKMFNVHSSLVCALFTVLVISSWLVAGTNAASCTTTINGKYYNLNRLTKIGTNIDWTAKVASDYDSKVIPAISI